MLEGGFRYPIATIRERALTHNVAAMAAYCGDRGVALAPHAKTSMAPELLRRQIEAGAAGLTVASRPQAQACWDAGFHKLLIANQLVARADVEWAVGALRADPRGVLTCFVDDVDVAVLLDAFARDAGGRLDVFVELGYAGGRCGCRDEGGAVALAARVVGLPGLRLAGVAGYEGLMTAAPNGSVVAAVDAFLVRLGSVAERVAAAGFFDRESGRPVVTAGGSAYFDRVVELLGPVAERIDAQLTLRSGCYVTHDHGVYERLAPTGRGAVAPRFEPALELWAEVLSRPESGTAIVGLGKRDAAFDTDLPVPVARVREGRVEPLQGASTRALNDQHLHLALEPAATLRPGDLVGFGISHPCAAFDRWRRLLLVDDAYRLTGVATTVF